MTLPFKSNKKDVAQRAVSTEQKYPYFCTMIKVALVGNGNVSLQLKHTLENNKNVKVLRVLESRGKALQQALDMAGQELPDVYIIAVSDDAISIVAEQLTPTKQLVVHTSGSVSLKALPKQLRRGVFYPLQTLGRSGNVDFTEVPLCIEAESNLDLTLLQNLAQSISEHVIEVSSEKRKQLHMAAVFANNFTNHLYAIAAEICDTNDIPFSLLLPLIKETGSKLISISPEEAQTGPARRGDTQTIEEHIKLLENKKHRALYQLFSESIKETYGKKL